MPVRSDVGDDTGCIHGVSWFAGHLAEGIKEHAQLGPAGALAAAISRTADLHRDTCDLSHPGTPSAAVAIVQVTGRTMRYLVLGDVTVVIDSADGIQVVSDQRVSQTAAAERATADAFPPGAVEAGETFEEAAARETAEEAGLNVEAVKMLDERVHPNTGRIMGYVACEVRSGTAYVADTEELADLAWVTPDKFNGYVPHGFAPMVQDYLAAALG